MKKLFLTVLFIPVILWSCGEDESSNSDTRQDNLPGDVKIEEITSSVPNEETTEAKQELKPQISADFQEFIDKFPHSSLPYKLNPDFDEDSENIYAKIPLEKQVKYLAKAEKLKKADFEEMAEYTDFYYVCNPLQTNNFTAIIYGRFEMGSVYYYLCTYNNKGDFISAIDFASLAMLGAGPQAGRYTVTEGEIDKNLKVTVRYNDLDGYTSDEEYQIKENGTIVKL
jgi:hypothetical protein